MKNSKNGLEVKGDMTQKAADRVGYMLATAALIGAFGIVLLSVAAIIKAI